MKYNIVTRSYRLQPALLLLLLICGLYAGAQKSYGVSGSVTDSLKQTPLSGVTISLFRVTQLQTPAATALTGGDGTFRVMVKDTGSYVVEISHAGYEKKVLKVVVEKEETTLPLQTLVLQSTLLKDVTVTSTKKLVEQMDDKIVYNVENDPLARSQNAIDILRRVPFVSVDGDENVRLNGQTNFKVLLNGRETAMFAQGVKEALQGFPGASIVKIEVITSPSAKWDAEGVGGIINIITKKKIEGYNASISTWNTSINQHVSSANLNAKMGTVGMALNYGIRTNINLPSTVTIETVPTIPSFYRARTLIGDRRATSFWNYGNGEISWALDSLNTLSLYGNMSGGNSKQVLDQQVITTFPNSTDPLRSQFDQWYRRQYPTNTVGTDFIRKFAGHPDKEFSFRINAELGENNSFLESEERGHSYSRFVINNAIATNRQYTLQTDYIQPVGKKAKLELGARATLRRAASDFESLVRYNAEDFKRNPANTDNFRFQQDVYAAYGSYSFKIKTYSIRTGLRLEHTGTSGHFQSAKDFATKGYTHLLPNLQVSNRFKSLALVLSYNQRLQRPFIAHLNPFVSNNDSLNISAGNPDLHAQTIHTVTLQSTLQKGKAFMGLTFSGSYSNNMIVNLLTFHPATGVRSSTFENIGRDFLFSVNGNINAPLGEKWMLNAFVNFQYRTLRNRKLLSQRNSGIGGNTSLGANYTINERFSINNYVGFEQAIIDLQSNPNTIPYCGSGVNYQVIPNKLRIGLMAQNYFAKYYDYITYMTGPTFEATQTSQSLMGKVVFTANWNFGKLKEKVSKKKGVTNDDTLTVQ